MRSTALISALLATVQLLSGTAAAAGGWTWPVRGPVLTRYVNGDDPYAAGQHRGVDIGAPVGTKVVAAYAGAVRFAGVVGSSGLTVSERTDDGRFELSYLHLSATAVRAGDRLEEGAVVGAVGTTGRRSVEAAHLHFSVREAGRRDAYRDPLDFLAPPPTADAPKPAPAPVPVAEPAAPEQQPAPTAPHVPISSPAPAPSPEALGAAPPFLAPSGAPLAAAAEGAHTPPHARPGPQVGPGARGAGAHPQPGSRRPVNEATTPRRSPNAPLPGLGPSTRPRPLVSQHARATAGTHHGGGGIDLGWLAACVGLVVAAALLAHPGQASGLARRGRSHLVGLLQLHLRAGGGPGDGVRGGRVRQ